MPLPVFSSFKLVHAEDNTVIFKFQLVPTKRISDGNLVSKYQFQTRLLRGEAFPGSGDHWHFQAPELES